MVPVIAVLCAFAAYGFAYRFHARYVSERIFRLDPDRTTPAHALQDGVDFVPTNRFVLFGHHWASITGLAPMLGPAVAVIWGWGPALLWVVLGAVFVGCVHDLAALALSLRAGGRSVGKVAEEVIGPRAKLLFLAIIFFGISLAMGVFTLNIAQLFAGDHATAVIPSAGLMVLAATMGVLVHRRGWPLGPVTLVGFIALIGLVVLGYRNPVSGLSLGTWSVILLAYAFAASVLPVWSLLQPRDFLNSLLLYAGLLVGFAGFFMAAPDFGAPLIDPSPEGAPPIFPFVFITIACGAASGFHGLVASGTTAKQLDRETDARLVGYGGMIGESLLGLLAVLATAAGISMGATDAAEVWRSHYASWDLVSRAPLENFIAGSGAFIETLGVERSVARAFIAVLVVSFALTTLDSATRLLRYNVSEIGESLRLPLLRERHLATAVAVLAIGFFTFFEVDGKPAGLALWRLFGTTNQLLAGLTLLAATLYLRQRRRSPWVTGVPMVFMLATTLVAMVGNLGDFSGGWSFGEGTVLPLLLVGGALLALALWLVGEAVAVTLGGPPAGGDADPPQAG